MMLLRRRGRVCGRSALLLLGRPCRTRLRLLDLVRPPVLHVLVHVHLLHARILQHLELVAEPPELVLDRGVVARRQRRVVERVPQLQQEIRPLLLTVSLC